MSKHNIGLKTLPLQGLSEPEFYADLGYKFRKIIGKNDRLLRYFSVAISVSPMFVLILLSMFLR